MIKQFSLKLILICFAMGCQPKVSDDETKTLVERHLQMRPEMRSEDVYKLLYQRRMGIGHLINDTNRAKLYLSDELNSIDENDVSVHDSLFEWISSDSTLLRINLRPFKKRKMSDLLLFQAMLGTMKNMKSEKNNLVRDWSEFINLNKRSYFNFGDSNTDHFNRFVQENDYPVIHHSETYARIYKPAYRILLYEEWKKYFTYE